MGNQSPQAHGMWPAVNEQVATDQDHGGDNATGWDANMEAVQYPHNGQGMGSYSTGQQMWQENVPHNTQEPQEQNYQPWGFTVVP